MGYQSSFGNVRDLAQIFQSHLYIFLFPHQRSILSSETRYCWWHEVYRFHNPTSSQQCSFHYCRHVYASIPWNPWLFEWRFHLDNNEKKDWSLAWPSPLISDKWRSDSQTFYNLKIFPTNGCGPPDLKYWIGYQLPFLPAPGLTWPSVHF